jgi:hypothetical protein
MPHHNPIVKFIREGKTGFVSYLDKEVEISFKLNVEYGVEECVAMIQVPSERDWEHLTQLTFKEKQQTLEIIGEEALKQLKFAKVYLIRNKSLDIFSE